MKPEKRGKKFLLIILDFPTNTLRCRHSSSSVRFAPTHDKSFVISTRVFLVALEFFFFSASKCLRFSFIKFSARVERKKKILFILLKKKKKTSKQSRGKPVYGLSVARNERKSRCKASREIMKFSFHCHFLFSLIDFFNFLLSFCYSWVVVTR